MLLGCLCDGGTTHRENMQTMEAIITLKHCSIIELLEINVLQVLQKCYEQAHISTLMGFLC